MSATHSIAAPKSVATAALIEEQDRIIDKAISFLQQRLFPREADTALSHPSDVHRFLQLKLMGEKRELFAVIFCDARHRPIAFEILSTGTLTHANVYPREVMERVLFHNAAAIIMAHNNPSGSCSEPSQADELVTVRLRESLALVDARVLDHVIIGEGTPYSFAESGLL